MQFQLGQMGAAIKAAKKLAFDTGVPYYIFGSGQGGYIVDAKLPTSVKAWSRFWPDGKADNHRTPVSEHRK